MALMFAFRRFAKAVDSLHNRPRVCENSDWKLGLKIRRIACKRRPPHEQCLTYPLNQFNFDFSHTLCPKLS